MLGRNVRRKHAEFILPCPIIVCLPLECLWSIAIDEVPKNINKKFWQESEEKGTLVHFLGEYN